MTASLGFLSVRRHSEHGYFGGYLITNHLARPLEFHCTMPVKPSRAQELLYGSTLDAFVCGEQIAKALVTKAKVRPQVVLTDCEAVLALRSVSDVAVAQLLPSQPPGQRVSVADTGESSSFVVPSGCAGDRECVHVGPWQLSVLTGDAQTERQLSETLHHLGSNWDVHEPFQRIVEALLEAHPIARAA